MKTETNKQVKPQTKTPKIEEAQSVNDELDEKQLEDVKGGLKMAPANKLREL